MKALCVCCSLLLALPTVYGQRVCSSRIPAEVKAAFSNTYPDSRSVRWERKEKAYEAEFHRQGREYEATYTPEGHLEELEENLRIHELPSPVSQQVAQDFPAYRLVAAERVKTREEEYYEVELRQRREVKEVMYTPEGQRRNQ
jgi:hypothetical protein